MEFARKLRAGLALVAVSLWILILDPILRWFVTPLYRLRGDAYLTGWIRWVARTVLGILRLGGVPIDLSERILGTPDTLILMNHQSLLDIPLAVILVEGRFPRIVTRDRYGRGIPLVSPMLRLMDCPLVSPGQRNRRQLQELTEIARTSEHPLLIYPEGTRSRDGRLGPFKRAGLLALLAGRSFEVRVVAVDGLWPAGKFADLPGALVGLRGRVAQAGPFRSPEPDGDLEGFVGEMEERMADLLAGLRESADGPAASGRSAT
ncbi:MAG: lysophospholipid acyltransferase family protein [bacterium]